MNENKFTTYLLYAVGEIILIMVGVFIAIQIDGQNQERLEIEAGLDNHQEIMNNPRKDSAFVNSITYYIFHVYRKN